MDITTFICKFEINNLTKIMGNCITLDTKTHQTYIICCSVEEWNQLINECELKMIYKNIYGDPKNIYIRSNPQTYVFRTSKINAISCTPSNKELKANAFILIDRIKINFSYENDKWVKHACDAMALYVKKRRKK
jgi:hypothetical protein